MSDERTQLLKLQLDAKQAEENAKQLAKSLQEVQWAHREAQAQGDAHKLSIIAQQKELAVAREEAKRMAEAVKALKEQMAESSHHGIADAVKELGADLPVVGKYAGMLSGVISGGLTPVIGGAIEVFKTFGETIVESIAQIREMAVEGQRDIDLYSRYSHVIEEAWKATKGLIAQKTLEQAAFRLGHSTMAEHSEMLSVVAINARHLAKVTGEDLESAMNKVTHGAITGMGRGLKDLQLNLKSTGDQQQDMLNMREALIANAKRLESAQETELTATQRLSVAGNERAKILQDNEEWIAKNTKAIENHEAALKRQNERLERNLRMDREYSKTWEDLIWALRTANGAIETYTGKTVQATEAVKNFDWWTRETAEGVRKLTAEEMKNAIEAKNWLISTYSDYVKGLKEREKENKRYASQAVAQERETSGYLKSLREQEAKESAAAYESQWKARIELAKEYTAKEIDTTEITRRSREMETAKARAGKLSGEGELAYAKEKSQVLMTEAKKLAELESTEAKRLRDYKIDVARTELEASIAMVRQRTETELAEIRKKTAEELRLRKHTAEQVRQIVAHEESLITAVKARGDETFNASHAKFNRERLQADNALNKALLTNQHNYANNQIKAELDLAQVERDQHTQRMQMYSELINATMSQMLASALQAQSAEEAGKKMLGSLLTQLGTRAWAEGTAEVAAALGAQGVTWGVPNPSSTNHWASAAAWFALGGSLQGVGGAIANSGSQSSASSAGAGSYSGYGTGSSSESKETTKNITTTNVYVRQRGGPIISYRDVKRVQKQFAEGRA